MKSSFAEYLHTINNSYCTDVPSMIDTHRFVDDLMILLFPIKGNRKIDLRETEIRLERMRLRLKELLIPLTKDLKDSPENIARQFFDLLPELYRSLLDDADSFVKSDPAARCVEEVILCYPGFSCLVVHRMANALFKLEVPVLPRVMGEYMHGLTGIDIHPGASIGKNFFIDHGTGIVIGETSQVGNNVKIYQGVTLGALYVEKNMTDTKRHPTIEDNVIIYAGSTILGGKTVVGHDTVIGGNVWLTESVMPHSVVYRQHKTLVKDSKSFEEPLNFVI
ncbi:MAG: serine acetyltransferase [Bacteroidales bacterium]|nr:serine acetyltransferase [Bacteroidales bacterium]MCB8999700.1 serine acetyltransferase [Bacteroidales bacterium]